jgi:hypothetical protein
MTSRNGEKWGWTGGWVGSFLWMGILSIVWLFQGKTVFGFAGILLFFLSVATIVLCSPWRHPKTPYWKLMLGPFLCIALCVVLALLAYRPMQNEIFRVPFTWLWILLLVLPIVTLGKRTWE